MNVAQFLDSLLLSPDIEIVEACLPEVIWGNWGAPFLASLREMGFPAHPGFEQNPVSMTEWQWKASPAAVRSQEDEHVRASQHMPESQAYSGGARDLVFAGKDRRRLR